jgi:hypothetical protein
VHCPSSYGAWATHAPPSHIADGTVHHPARWVDPRRFDPGRFRAGPSHRGATLAVIASAVRALAGTPHTVPAHNPSHRTPPDTDPARGRAARCHEFLRKLDAKEDTGSKS